MTTGLPELPVGQELTPGRSWWRRLRFLPLILLALASILALIIGIVTSAQQRQRASLPAPVSPSAAPEGVAALCRPPLAPPAQQPWWDDSSAAEAEWDLHADELAEPFVVGPNGWMFWSDQVDQYVSQAVGRTYLNEPQVQQWIDHLTAVRDGLAAEGVEFYVIVTPSTSSVYPEELPLWMQELRGPTILDQFVAAAKDLPVLDLRARLIEQKVPDTHLFSWDNSHWTDYGAFASWSQITECVNGLYPDGESLRVPAVSGAEIIGDFNEWASYGGVSPGADWASPVYAEPVQEVTRSTADGASETFPGATVTDAGILPVETTVPDSWTGKSALIFRDSMGGGLSPLWQQAYSPTWQIWHRYRAGFEDPLTYREYVERYRPDVVVVQLAERHLVNTPATGSGY